MTNKIEKKKNFIIGFLYLAIILALVFVFFRYLFWPVAPFLLSFFFAIILQRPLRWLDKKTKNKHHTLWSILLIVFSICLIIVPLIFILSELFSKIGEFGKYLFDQLNDIPTFLATLEKEILDLIKFLPDKLYNTLSENITGTFSRLIEDFNITNLFKEIGVDTSTITSGVSSGISGVFSVVKNIPSVLIGIVIGIISWIFFTKDYNYIVRFIQKQLPDSKKNLLVEVKQVFSKTILKMFRAYGLIMLITFLELFLGFTILSLVGIMDNGYYALIAVGIAIFDILPVAGSGGILIPWALVSLVSGNYQQAIGLIVIYVVISVIRQYIEPKIVGDSLGVHPLITLMGLYLGYKVFGFIGMFVVPITVMTLKAFNDTGRIQLWKTIERN